MSLSIIELIAHDLESNHLEEHGVPARNQFEEFCKERGINASGAVSIAMANLLALIFKNREELELSDICSPMELMLSAQEIMTPPDETDQMVN
jgi:hypothetical protein